MSASSNNVDLGPILSNLLTKNSMCQTKLLPFLISITKQLNNFDANILADICEELLAMDQPQVVLNMVEHYGDLRTSFDFRNLRAEGLAAMYLNQLDKAEEVFYLAHKMLPLEPAPYVNLVQIYAKDKRFDDMLTWIHAGLKQDSNYFPLWEQIHNHHEHLSQSIFELAIQYNSWVGECLALDLRANSTLNDKIGLLQKYYDRGNVSNEFLIEYTAILGQDGQYDKILQIVWQASSLRQETLGWQLLMHAAQAALASEKKQLAQEYLKRLQQMVLPDDVKKMVTQLDKEG